MTDPNQQPIESLWSIGYLNAQALADLVGVAKAELTRGLAALEDQGLLRRRGEIEAGLWEVITDPSHLRAWFGVDTVGGARPRSNRSADVVVGPRPITVTGPASDEGMISV